jgi:hypothetical protein
MNQVMEINRLKKLIADSQAIVEYLEGQNLINDFLGGQNLIDEFSEMLDKVNPPKHKKHPVCTTRTRRTKAEAAKAKRLRRDGHTIRAVAHLMDIPEGSVVYLVNR